MTRTKDVGKLIVACLTGLVVGILGCYYSLDRTPPALAEVDLDQDGKWDERTYAEEGFIVRVEYDGNRDGIADRTAYSNQGVMTRVVTDLDFDGKVDSWLDLRGGKSSVEERDLDGDGIVDLSIVYKFDRPVREYYKNHTGVIIGVAFFERGYGGREYRDLDNDGKFESLIVTSELGLIKSSGPLPTPLVLSKVESLEASNGLSGPRRE